MTNVQFPAFDHILEKDVLKFGVLFNIGEQPIFLHSNNVDLTFSDSEAVEMVAEWDKRWAKKVPWDKLNRAEQRSQLTSMVDAAQPTIITEMYAWKDLKDEDGNPYKQVMFRAHRDAAAALYDAAGKIGIFIRYAARDGILTGPSHVPVWAEKDPLDLASVYGQARILVGLHGLIRSNRGLGGRYDDDGYALARLALRPKDPRYDADTVQVKATAYYQIEGIQIDLTQLMVAQALRSWGWPTIPHKTWLYRGTRCCIVGASQEPQGTIVTTNQAAYVIAALPNRKAGAVQAQGLAGTPGMGVIPTATIPTAPGSGAATNLWGTPHVPSTAAPTRTPLSGSCWASPGNGSSCFFVKGDADEEDLLTMHSGGSACAAAKPPASPLGKRGFFGGPLAAPPGCSIGALAAGSGATPSQTLVPIAIGHRIGRAEEAFHKELNAVNQTNQSRVDALERDTARRLRDMDDKISGLGSQVLNVEHSVQEVQSVQKDDRRDRGLEYQSIMNLLIEIKSGPRDEASSASTKIRRVGEGTTLLAAQTPDPGLLAGAAGPLGPQANGAPTGLERGAPTVTVPTIPIMPVGPPCFLGGRSGYRSAREGRQLLCRLGGGGTGRQCERGFRPPRCCRCRYGRTASRRRGWPPVGNCLTLEPEWTLPPHEGCTGRTCW